MNIQLFSLIEKLLETDIFSLTLPVYRVLKSYEIMMFVCLPKVVKQLCDAKTVNCTHCGGQ